MVADVDDEDDRIPTIAGHPLVRAIRRDATREVWVAADAAGSGVELHRSMPGEEALLAREAEALLLGDHPHLVPILDVATDAGVVLVRPLLPHDLADWLLERGSPQPGEAVTALAPIAAALGALHAAGAAVGGVTAQQVRLDADGAPLLLGEGARVETARPSPAWRDASSTVAADAAGWRALAEAVLAASGTEVPGAVGRALEARDLVAAGEALLAAWPALPLALEPTVAARAATGARVRHRARPVGADAVWARAALVLEALAQRIPALPVALGSRLQRRPGREPCGHPHALGGRIAPALRAVRPRFWALAGVAAAAVAAAVLLLPAGSGAAGEAAQGESAQEDSAQEEPISSPAAGAPDVQAPEPDASAAPAAAEPAAPTITDDPIEGAAMLLAEREACLDADDAACLVGLHEPGSPQLTAVAPWRIPADGRLELVQRLGDAWLLRVVSNDEPASVLVMSTEAGWTLRDAWVD